MQIVLNACVRLSLANVGNCEGITELCTLCCSPLPTNASQIQHIREAKELLIHRYCSPIVYVLGQRKGATDHHT